MSIFRKVREELGKNRWEMHKLLGVTIQRMSRLDDETQRVEPELLHRLYKVSGLSAQEFIDLLGAPAPKKRRKNKARKV